MARRVVAVLGGWLFAAAALFSQGFVQHKYFTGLNPQSVVSADLNADGRKDIAVAAYDERAIVIHFGNGDGTLAPAVYAPVCGFARKIVTGDFNHDGVADLATLNDPMSEATPECPVGDIASITLLYGHAGQTSGWTTQTYAVGKFNRDMAVGDIDGNHYSDLVSIATDRTATTFTFSGAGVLQTDSSLPITNSGFTTRLIALGDFNGDGKADLVVGGCCTQPDLATGTNYILASDGRSFPTQLGEIPGFSYALLTADINDDGKTDVVASIDRGRMVPDLIVFRNSGNNTFTEAKVYDHDTFNSNAFSPVVGDFSGDSLDDLAFLVTDHVFSNGTEYLIVIPQHGDGTFWGRWNIPIDNYAPDQGPRALAWMQLAGSSALPDLVSTDTIRNLIVTLTNTTDATVGGGCRPPTTMNPAINICAPMAGATATSPVRLRAAATVSPDVYRMEVWEAGKKLFTARWTDQLDTKAWLSGGGLPMSPGAHTLTFTATNAAGTSKASKNVTFTVSGPACPTPGSNGINVCSPADGSTADNPLHVQAAAKVSGAIYRFELWVDGAKFFIERDNGVMDRQLTVAPGTHRLDFIARNADGSSRVTKTIRVTAH